MINPSDTWHIQTLDSPNVLNFYTAQLHHAAQLVAMVGHSLLPKEADDAQSSMEWITRRGALLGRDIRLAQTIKMALLYHPFELHIFDHNMDSLDNLNLEGRTKQVAINWIKDHITVLGGDASMVKPISHFEAPRHPLDEGAVFELPNPVFHVEMAKYRSNANLLLNELTLKLEHATAPRIWPHHFDTGSYIPLAFDEDQKVTHSISIGMAIADDDIEEYYYYINHWTAQKGPSYGKLPELSGGHWSTKNPTRAVLPISELLVNTEAQAQHQQALNFFHSGINASLKLLGIKESVL